MSECVRVCVCLCICACMCVCVTIVRTFHTLSKFKNTKKLTFVDFDICYQMASLQKLYSMTLTYFLKVKILKFYYL